jgi:hypothetical protein
MAPIIQDKKTQFPFALEKMANPTAQHIEVVAIKRRAGVRDGRAGGG